MSHDQQARELLASLRNVAADEPDAEAQEAREEAHVRHLEAYLREHRARHGRPNLGWRRAGAGLAAAALLFGLGAAAKELLFDAPPPQPPAEEPEVRAPAVPPSPPRSTPERRPGHPTEPGEDEPTTTTTGREARPARAAERVRTPKPTATAHQEESTLAEQNALFTAAVKARRSGEPGKAMGLLDQLLSRYPRSPLADQAKVERARALQDLAHP